MVSPYRLLLLASILTPHASAEAQPAGLEIHFLDVGQGEAIVIRAPEGKTALIDAGPDGRVVRRLERLGVQTIDFALATHAHADHIGGMSAVLRSLEVRYFMDNGVPHTSAAYRRLMRELEAREGVTYLEARARTLELGGARLRVLPPPRGAEGQNNRSVGLLVEHGAFRALLTGDSEVEELNHFLTLDLPSVEVLKAAHHGSRDGVTPAWLATTSPRAVVISCGRGNPYGHPHPWALRYYRTAAERVYRTDRHGTVTVRAARDGSFTVTTGRDAAERIQPSALKERADPLPVSLRVWADAPGNDHDNPNGEYVELSNASTSPIPIEGWRLCDAADHCFTFPEGATLPAKGSVRLFSGRGREGEGRFFMNSGRAVWNNGGDIATLYDREGGIITRYEY